MYVSCLCGFLGVELCFNNSNNVNKDHGKVKEVNMTEEKCSGGSDTVTTQPVAVQRSRKSSKSKNSKNKR